MSDTADTNGQGRRADKLLHKMWRTKGSQFNARIRLDRRHWMSIGATSILACYLIAGSLYQLVFEGEISKVGLRYLTVINLVVSVFLIIITLIESAKNYAGQAEKMHDSALDIAELYNRFQALSHEQMDAQRMAFADEYSAVLKRHAMIHSDLDFALFKWSNARDIPLDIWQRLGLIPTILLQSISEYWLYVTLTIVPPIAFYLLLPMIRSAA